MLQCKCAVTDKRHLTLPILLTMVILSCCSGAIASAGDIVSDSGAAEGIQKAAEIARPGILSLFQKGSFHFIVTYFCPME